MVKKKVRIRLVIRGAVQGVGFRPFVYRLATEIGLAGWVENSAQGVTVEVEGDGDGIERFQRSIELEKPPHCLIQSILSSHLEAAGYSRFEIRASEASGEKTALILPDIATCGACVREILDPLNRRFLYPFTNCTHCGPRFSIIQALPYDRCNTSMNCFGMCERCKREYDDPLDRRFHAQPNACPECGPQVELWDEDGTRLTSRHPAILGAARAIREGAIVAVKGIGGFHLMLDARNESAVRKLRELKHRRDKPFAVMFPSLEAAKEQCEVSFAEAGLLRSPEAPIVLLRRRSFGSIAPSVAPGNPCLGVMLPYSPLHHILLAELGLPVVATSGNRAEETICIDENEALQRLSSIGSRFLVHNRPIARPVDDSVVGLMMGGGQLLRRARGHAPLPIMVDGTHGALHVTLAVGAHQKNAIAMRVEEQVFLSQHLGDLDSESALKTFRSAIADFQRLYEVKPSRIVSDAHPDYISTRFAQKARSPHTTVQHHYAHALSCMADNALNAPLLAAVWDGTGYGGDGTLWGGEFLKVTQTSFARFAHFRTFPLPGGEMATREPRRAALGILYEIFSDAVFEMKELAPVRAFSAGELMTLKAMLGQNINSPRTSSIGRIFDSVASLIGLRHLATFEGQAAMDVEFSADRSRTAQSYSLEINGGIIDWQPMIRAIIDDILERVPADEISGKFHNALVEALVAVAYAAGERQVVLTGGCFQNRRLAEHAIRRLQAEGFSPYWHHRIPPNDGGIALGQIVADQREGVLIPSPSTAGANP